MKVLGTLAVLAASALIAGTAAAQDLKIGASLPLTGGLSISGEKHKRGYELCTKLINEAGGILGRKVELIVSDNRSDPATAINQYERFINVDKVEALYGTFSSRLTYPIAAILAKYNMVHPVPSGGALRIYSQGYKNLVYFQVNAAEYTGKDVVGVIKESVAEADRPKTAAVVYADDFFANAIAAGLLGQKVINPANDQVIAVAVDRRIRHEIVNVDVVGQVACRRRGRVVVQELAEKAERLGLRQPFQAEITQLHGERLGLVVQRGDGAIELCLEQGERVSR